MNVLIVDDHLMFGEALRVLLEAEADVEEVGVAGTAELALEMVERSCPDVILMDVDLPGMNGIDATRHVLSRCRDAHVVIISALQDPQLMARAVDAGSSGFVAKSRAADELVHVIRTAAAGDIVLPEARAADILRDLQAMRRRTVSQGPPARLTDREREVLQVFADGLSTHDVAQQLFISERTVQSHLRSILSKLDLSSKLQAVVWALRQGEITLKKER